MLKDLTNQVLFSPDYILGAFPFSDPPEPVILEVPQEEERSLAQWINNNLECDEDCSHLLPLESDGGDLYQKIGDGILLW